MVIRDGAGAALKHPDKTASSRCLILFSLTRTKKRRSIRYWGTQDSNFRRLEKNRSRDSKRFAAKLMSGCKKCSHPINGNSVSRNERKCEVAIIGEEETDRHLIHLALPENKFVNSLSVQASLSI